MPERRPDLDLVPVVEQVVSERVQPGEVDAQVGDLQQVLHLVTVRVGRRQARRQRPENHLRTVRHRTMATSRTCGSIVDN